MSPRTNSKLGSNPSPKRGAADFPPAHIYQKPAGTARTNPPEERFSRLKPASNARLGRFSVSAGYIERQSLFGVDKVQFPRFLWRNIGTRTATRAVRQLWRVSKVDILRFSLGGRGIPCEGRGRLVGGGAPGGLSTALGIGVLSNRVAACDGRPVPNTLPRERSLEVLRRQICDLSYEGIVPAVPFRLSAPRLCRTQQAAAFFGEAMFGGRRATVRLAAFFADVERVGERFADRTVIVRPFRVFARWCFLSHG